MEQMIDLIAESELFSGLPSQTLELAGRLPRTTSLSKPGLESSPKEKMPILFT